MTRHDQASTDEVRQASLSCRSRTRFDRRASRQETGLRQDAKAQAEQVRAVAIQRVGVKVGLVPTSIMADLDEALRMHLAL